MPLNISHDIPMKSRSITDVGPTFSHAGFDLGQREPKGDEKQPAWHHRDWDSPIWPY